MRHKAILKLYPNVKSVSDAFGAFDENHDLVEVDENLVQEKVAELQADYDSKQYQRDRLKEYNAIGLGEQLDMIYHDMDGWKAKIKAVKDKYPKPE